jgi:hypothetical protein
VTLRDESRLPTGQLADSTRVSIRDESDKVASVLRSVAGRRQPNVGRC